ncbi:hypothetical protein M433DRAFT_154761 [Acidomyces richmondensis BFW]|nr:MAG: hypothetical protein FE78DRAFT_91035 [Acidomyces sp. 'richmondensis']KYG45230.1 hypothetical protein M433DRAFT_154761 [Acidomyces richmondensis BFW]
MFGLIISGRPVDASPQAITQSQYAFRITPAPPFSHIVVFVLPGAQLPSDTAASVYVQIPPSQEFKLLGAIGPGKESAIFKINGLKPGAQSAGGVEGDVDVMTDDPAANDNTAATSGSGDIVVGVSIEPVAQVEAQLATIQQNKSSAPPQSGAVVRFNSGMDSRVTTKVLAQRIIGNAFNFLASFGSDTVPLKAFQDWWAKFEKKVELDPSFLERAE